MAIPPPPPMPHSRLEEGLGPGGPPAPPVPPLSEEIPLFIVCMNVVSTVTHLLLGGVAITAFICINIFSYVFHLPTLTAHVYLTVIGYVFLMSQAVLSLKPQMGWVNNFKYPQKTKVYWGLQVFGSTLAVVGGAMGIAASEGSFTSNNAPPFELPGLPSIAVRSRHLYSVHQIVGFVAMLVTSGSLVGGFVNLVCTSKLNSSFFKAMYACVSTLTLMIAFVAIILAIEEFRELLLNTNTNLVVSFAVLSVVCMLTMMLGNFLVGGKFII